MDSKYSQSLFTTALPMAMAKDFDVRLDFYKALFRRRQGNFSRQEKCRQGLAMPATQTPPRPENRPLYL